jgi:alpha-tubulin suppressor-like RCC1 family protein
MPYLKPTEIVTNVACAYSFSVIGAYSHETGNSSLYVIGQIVWVGSGHDCEATYTFPNQKIKKIDAGSFHLVVLFESGLVYTGGENALKLGRDKNTSPNKKPFDMIDTIQDQPCIDVCCASNETFVLTAENKLYHFTNYGEKIIKTETIMQSVYASGNMVMVCV